MNNNFKVKHTIKISDLNKLYCSDDCNVKLLYNIQNCEVNYICGFNCGTFLFKTVYDGKYYNLRCKDCLFDEKEKSLIYNIKKLPFRINNLFFNIKTKLNRSNK